MKFWISLLTISLPVAALACWPAVSDEQLIEGRPLIIVGQIERIKEAKPRGDERLDDIANLRVSEVLKNTTGNSKIKKGSVLRLAMPSKNNRSQMSTDIYYSKGSRGVWLLGYDKKTQMVGAGYPFSLRNSSEKPKIERIIAGRPAPTPTPEIGVTRGAQ